ncbi:hypothetical protein Tco_1499821 [Tanacetum coccineum]
MSLGHSARVTEAMALSDSPFRKRYRSSYETPSPSPSLTLPVHKRYRGTSELILDTDSEGDELGDEEDESSFSYRALRHRELAVEDDQRTLDTWVDPKDGRVYTDIPAYVPLAAPVQTPRRSLGSLPVSPSSPVVPSPIASLVATPTATISVDEDQFIEVGAQLELHGSILQDHTQRLDALPPTLIMDIDRDVRELYTRALWRPMLALEAWAGHVDTRLADMSWARYDKNRLIHDMLVQQAVMQRELQEMRGRVTALEQERERREQ